MSLLPCDGWHGEIDFRTEEPRFAIYRDAIYVPARMGGYDPDARWGLYDSNGDIIPEGAYRRGPYFDYQSTGLVGQSEMITEADKIDSSYSDDEYLYMGPLQEHYGHFIVSALARAWFLIKNGRHERKLLFHSNSPVLRHSEKEYFRIIMNALDIKGDDIVILDGPTRLRSVLVPAPAFQELSFACSLYAETGHHIATKLGMGVQPRRKKPVYLSKARLESGIWKFESEEAITEVLEAKGFDIVYPERLSFVDQVELFNQCSFISGSAGSALHTSLFSMTPVRIYGVCFERKVASNFPLLDRVMNHDSKYFYPNDAVRIPPCPGFHLGFKIDDPAAVALSIVREYEYG